LKIIHFGWQVNLAAAAIARKLFLANRAFAVAVAILAGLVADSTSQIGLLQLQLLAGNA